MKTPVFDEWLKWMAWTYLALIALKTAAIPFMIGKPQDWEWSDFWTAVITAGMLTVPICGRILGWW